MIEDQAAKNTEEATNIHMLAGQRPDGELVFEDVRAKDIGDGCYQLLTSPVFAKGAAKKDVVRMHAAGKFDIEQHNGNLCVRVLAKNNIDTLKKTLETVLKHLEAELDFSNERILVYSIPVAAGFNNIEKALNQAIQTHAESLWVYANVYDPMDGETPLNWWHDYLAK